MKPVWVVRHVPHEGLGIIADSLRRCEVPFVTIDAFAGTLPSFKPRELSGLIVMGGPMNADQTDRFPFLGEEVRWLREAVDADLPVLGVCLGSQLLAKSLGAQVRANGIKEIGWYEIELLPSAATDPLFHDLIPPRPLGVGRGEGADIATPEPRTLNPQLTVFQWHGDTFNLPASAAQLARSPQCENQAFRFGRAAYGLQFHMEVTDAIINDWLCETGNCGELAELNYIDPAAIRRQTPEKLPPMQALGRTVFDRFANLCRSR